VPFNAIPQSILYYYGFILVVASLDLPRFGSVTQRDILDESYLNIDKLPITPFTYYAFKNIGRNCISTGILLIFSGTYLVLTNYSPLGLLLFIPSIICAYLLAQLIWFNLGILTFYFEEIHMWLFSIVFEFISGKMIPIPLFPHAIQIVLLILPFSNAFGALAKNFSPFNLQGLLMSLTISLAWSYTLFKLSQTLWQKGSYYFQENG
jgi:ABC-type uncharacterized transport system permease subunit